DRNAEQIDEPLPENERNRERDDRRRGVARGLAQRRPQRRTADDHGLRRRAHRPPAVRTDSCHQSTRRSLKFMSSVSVTPVTARNMTAANIERMSRVSDVSLMILPMPWVAPKNSPTIAPISARLTLTLSAAKRYGSADIHRSRTRISQRLAPTLRKNSSASGSTDRRPVMQL